MTIHCFFAVKSYAQDSSLFGVFNVQFNQCTRVDPNLIQMTTPLLSCKKIGVFSTNPAPFWSEMFQDINVLIGPKFLNPLNNEQGLFDLMFSSSGPALPFNKINVVWNEVPNMPNTSFFGNPGAWLILQGYYNANENAFKNLSTDEVVDNVMGHFYVLKQNLAQDKLIDGKYSLLADQKIFVKDNQVYVKPKIIKCEVVVVTKNIASNIKDIILPFLLYPMMDRLLENKQISKFVNQYFPNDFQSKDQRPKQVIFLEPPTASLAKNSDASPSDPLNDEDPEKNLRRMFAGTGLETEGITYEQWRLAGMPMPSQKESASTIANRIKNALNTYNHVEVTNQLFNWKKVTGFLPAALIRKIKIIWPNNIHKTNQPIDFSKMYDPSAHEEIWDPKGNSSYPYSSELSKIRNKMTENDFPTTVSQAVVSMTGFDWIGPYILFKPDLLIGIDGNPFWSEDQFQTGGIKTQVPPDVAFWHTRFLEELPSTGSLILGQMQDLGCTILYVVLFETQDHNLSSNETNHHALVVYQNPEGRTKMYLHVQAYLSEEESNSLEEKHNFYRQWWTYLVNPNAMFAKNTGGLFFHKNFLNFIAQKLALNSGIVAETITMYGYANVREFTSLQIINGRERTMEVQPFKNVMPRISRHNELKIPVKIHADPDMQQIYIFEVRPQN